MGVESENEFWRKLPAGFADQLEHESQLTAATRQVAFEQVHRTLPEPPRLIVDLGSGTGADSVALAQRFPEARVHALDISAELLERVRAAAQAAGCGERVTTHRVDLDTDWTIAIPQAADLVWAALSIHHLADPAAALRRVHTVLRSRGVLLLTELIGDARHSVGDHGHAAASAHDHSGAPSPHAQPPTHWTGLLEATGFTAIDYRVYEEWEDLAPRGVWIACRPDDASASHGDTSLLTPS